MNENDGFHSPRGKSGWLASAGKKGSPSSHRIWSGHTGCCPLTSSEWPCWCPAVPTLPGSGWCSEICLWSPTPPCPCPAASSPLQEKRKFSSGGISRFLPTKFHSFLIALLQHAFLPQLKFPEAGEIVQWLGAWLACGQSELECLKHLVPWALLELRPESKAWNSPEHYKACPHSSVLVELFTLVESWRDVANKITVRITNLLHLLMFWGKRLISKKIMKF